MNKKGLFELRKKRDHKKWRYNELKKKLLTNNPNWKP